MNVSLRGVMWYTANRQNTVIQFLYLQSVLILCLYIHRVGNFRITCPKYEFLSHLFFLIVFVVVSCILTAMLRLSLLIALWPLILHSFRTFFLFSLYSQSECNFSSTLVVVIYCSLRIFQSLLYLYIYRISHVCPYLDMYAYIIQALCSKEMLKMEQKRAPKLAAVNKLTIVHFLKAVANDR